MSTSVRSTLEMTADKVKFRGEGISFTATAGVATTYDRIVAEARLLDGIQLILKDQAFGDSVDFKIVDVDNTLGYGAGVVLDTFSTGWRVVADTQDQGQIRLPYAAEVLAGLYVRIVYHSVGGTNVSIMANLFAHKYIA